MKIDETSHQIVIGSSDRMDHVKNESIALVVTSPPYPMIEMWDEIFSKQNPKIKESLELNNGSDAFELMHMELDKVWSEVKRVLIPGGFVCINIGDATRTINGDFRLYSNHSRIISSFQKLGIFNLPNILWRKQTNAPNKFMGSGMLPSGAYVTLEHEWILVFRKGGKREFKTEEEKLRRKESSFFWEERNVWFSDLWDLKGVKQKVENSETRKRSAAYPFEIPYRLINMYSLKGDLILDPFLGMGTSILASITSQRDSIGYEIDESFFNIIHNNIESTPYSYYNSFIENRITQHNQFILDRNNDPKKDDIKHFNNTLKMQVMTSQETDIKLSFVDKVQMNNEKIVSYYNSVKPNEVQVSPKTKRKTEGTLFDI
jgi:DNA modification methylase